MNGLDFLLLKDITRKQGAHQQHNKNKKRPGAEELLGCSFGSISYNPLSSEPAAGYIHRRTVSIPSSGSESESVALPIN